MIDHIISDLEKTKIANIATAYTEVERLEHLLDKQRRRAEEKANEIRGVFDEFAGWLRRNQDLLELLNRTNIEINLGATLENLQRSNAINATVNQNHTINIVCNTMTPDQFKALHSMLNLDAESLNKDKLETTPIFTARLRNDAIDISSVLWRIIHPSTGKPCLFSMEMYDQPMVCKVKNMGSIGIVQVDGLLNSTQTLSVEQDRSNANRLYLYKSTSPSEQAKYRALEETIKEQQKYEEQFNTFKNACSLYGLDVEHPIKHQALRNWFAMLHSTGPVSISTWVEANNQLAARGKMVAIQHDSNFNAVMHNIGRQHEVSLEAKRLLKTNVLQSFPNLDPRDAFQLSVKFYSQHMLPSTEANHERAAPTR